MFNVEDIHSCFSKSSLLYNYMLKDDKLMYCLKENFNQLVENNSESLKDAFWYFMENEESQDKNEYFEIKKKYFKKIGLNLGEVKKMESPEIVDWIKKTLIKKVIFDFEIIEKPFATIYILIDYILNRKTVESSYKIFIEGEDISASFDTWRIIGRTEISEENEIDLVQEDKIDYNYLSDFTKKDLYILSDYKISISSILTNKIEEEIRENNFFVKFLYTENDSISYDVLENMIVLCDVSFYQIEEVWQKYLYESIKLFEEEKFQTAFLVGFSALDSLIEFILYRLQKYIESLKINPNIVIDSFSDLLELENNNKRTFIKSKFEKKEDLYWYIEYTQLLNHSRRLIDEKFKQILKIIVCNFDFENKDTIFRGNTIYSKLKDSLIKLEKIRNQLAHGDKVILKNEKGEHYSLEGNQMAYIKLYGELILCFANIISLINGIEK